jgi:hypothetical protein
MILTCRHMEERDMTVGQHNATMSLDARLLELIKVGAPVAPLILPADGKWQGEYAANNITAYHCTRTDGSKHNEV